MRADEYFHANFEVVKIESTRVKLEGKNEKKNEKGSECTSANCQNLRVWKYVLILRGLVCIFGEILRVETGITLFLIAIHKQSGHAVKFPLFSLQW